MSEPALVRNVVFRFDEAQFDSTESAIAAVFEGPRAEREEKCTRAIAGEFIENIGYSDNTVAFALVGGPTLTLFLNGNKVDWTLDQAAANLSPVSADPDPVRLVFPTREELWDRTHLLRQRVGKKMNGLFAGTAWAYVYVENTMTLCFSRLAETDVERNLLYWWETP
jgi:hypothetical protein